MALRRSATGQRFVEAGSEISADAPFEAHLPKLALYCLRLTGDPQKAVLLAERVLLEARRRIASLGEPGPSALLFRILREECARAARPKPAPAASLKPLRAAGETP